MGHDVTNATSVQVVYGITHVIEFVLQAPEK
jgi:hypothetical protein